MELMPKITTEREPLLEEQGFESLSPNDLIRLVATAWAERENPSGSELREQITRWREHSDSIWVQDGTHVTFEVHGEEYSLMEYDTAEDSAKEQYEELAGEYERELEAWKYKGNLCNLPVNYIDFNTEMFVQDCMIQDCFGILTSYDGRYDEVFFKYFSQDGDRWVCRNWGAHILWRTD